MYDLAQESNRSRNGRCEGCEYCKMIGAAGPIEWGFYGCFCPPYRGKWVAEIKDCPKEVIDNVAEC